MSRSCIAANYAHATLNFNGVQATVIFKQNKRFTRDGFTSVIVKTIRDFPGAQDTLSFPYHIHDKPVNATGNCDSTGPHFDPHHANASNKNIPYNCVMSNPNSCEVGDLSGKHHKLSGQKETISYVDTTLPGLDVLLTKSVVVHANDGTTKRLACANIQRGKPDLL